VLELSDQSLSPALVSRHVISSASIRFRVRSFQSGRNACTPIGVSLNRRSNPGLNKGLRLPQRSDFFVQIVERRFKRFAVMAALRGNEVPHHSGPGQLQAFPFALPVQCFLAESRALAVSAPALSQFHLRFDRLAFPTSSHILQSVIPRTYARNRSLCRLRDLI